MIYSILLNNINYKNKVKKPNINELKIKVVRTVLFFPKMSAQVAQKFSWAGVLLGLGWAGLARPPAAPSDESMDPKADCWGCRVERFCLG